MHSFPVYWISLYMFRTVFPSIIRSSRLYTQHQVYVIEVRWLFASGHLMELQFHLVPASKQSTNLYDIYLMLCVQSWTPDDGRKDRPKHVEWYSINSKNCASSWFYHRKLIYSYLYQTIRCHISVISTNTAVRTWKFAISIVGIFFISPDIIKLN